MASDKPSGRINKVVAAVNAGSFRVSAMIAGIDDNGELQVMGSGHRASQGIRRGYVTDMQAATLAIKNAVERAEGNAGVGIDEVWVGCSGGGLRTDVPRVEIGIGGRRIEEEDREDLLLRARASIQPNGQTIMHAQPAQYTLDGAHGVIDPIGLYAEMLHVDVHVMLADSAPIRNLTEAVQNAHLKVAGIVASPVASSLACLTEEERELGVALVEIGGDVTNIGRFERGLLVDLVTLPMGSSDITDAIASTFGIRRFQAERLKCVSGSAIASPSDHREMIPVNGPEDQAIGHLARGADDKNRIARAELVSVVTKKLSELTDEIGRALKSMGFGAGQGGQVVVTGGGAELAGLADYAQGALGLPVRIGPPGAIIGLPEAHSTPGFATLSGLCLYAAQNPIDIMRLQPSFRGSGNYNITQSFTRLWRMLREQF